jgi:hypothetical protein
MTMHQAEPTSQPTSTGSPRQPDELARVRDDLERRRERLIDLTRRNPLIALRRSRLGQLMLSRPDVVSIFERLCAGKVWQFWLPPEVRPGHGRPGHASRLKANPDELVCETLERRELIAVLTNLYRRSRHDFQERGLRSLQVIFGVVEWLESPQLPPVRSPLVVVPVVLDRASPRDPFVLGTVEEEPIANPALAMRLQRDHGLSLPAFDTLDENGTLDLPAYFDRVTGMLEALPSARLERCAILSMLSFEKGVIHQDLGQSAAVVCQHPLVRALAGDPSVIFAQSQRAPAETELDRLQDPRDLFTVLDADASQRRCLEAARRGQSFVLFGPPGTGKSQTITNLIADRLAAGQTVLFVSEKPAALDVVYRRLRQVGLGDHCLELHSHLTQRSRVVRELYRCLTEEFTLPPEPSEARFARLRQYQDALNGYVDALQQPRQPLGMSVADALAELGHHAEVPLVPVELDQPLAITPEWFEQAKAAVREAARLGGLLDGTAGSPWAGFATDRPLTAARKQQIVARLDALLTAAARLREALDLGSQAVGATGDIDRLLQVLTHLDASPCPPVEWLTSPYPQRIAADLSRLAELHRCVREIQQTLATRYGPDFLELANGLAQRIEAAWKQCAELLAPDESGQRLLQSRAALRVWAKHTLLTLDERSSDAQTLARPLALADPPATVAGQRQLIQTLRLLPPALMLLPGWLQATGLHQARAALEAVAEPLACWQQRWAELSQRYDSGIFELDLATLSPPHWLGWLTQLLPSQRRQRAALLRVCRGGKIPPTLQADLPRLRELAQTRAALSGALDQLSRQVGPYFRGMETPLDTLRRAIDLAGQLLQQLHWLKLNDLPASLRESIIAGLDLPPEVSAARDRLDAELTGWVQSTAALAGLLPDLDELCQVPMQSIRERAANLLTRLDQLESALAAVMVPAIRPPVDLRQLVADLRQLELSRAWVSLESAEIERRQQTLGPLYRGLDATDWPTLQRMWQWCQTARELFADSIPEGFIAAASQPTRLASASRLRQALADYSTAREQLLAELDGLRGRLEGLPLTQMEQAARQLSERIDELADWFDLQKLPERFARLGLTRFYDQLCEQDLQPEQFPGVFCRAVLTEWLEAVLQADPILARFRGNEQAHLAGEFRAMDRSLIHDNPVRIKRRVLAQRPVCPLPIPGSEVEQLYRQALIRTRHLPLRQLFAQIPQLLLRLKPCLLMSPSTVSQFLPAELFRFDLVVFDEASQIPTEDALGAIARAKQVIVVGDDKQLPPTAFFQIGNDPASPHARADYAGILDECRAVLPAYSLRWHYRSRHESLIAFSNQHFYDGRLVTFPATVVRDEQLGVRLHYVPDGVYDRGGRRDNRREAEVVAELVVQQLKAQPHRTVGVIAFSQAQMWAIESQLDRRRRADPSLERFFSDDRLESVFVRNLETVQGDERDVIFLSVGYGPDAAGRPSLNFGPLNRVGGEKRLNVAVTRARELLVLVSSIRACHIPVRATFSEGVNLLRRYLDYAERGEAALREDHAPQPQPRSPQANGLIGWLQAELHKLGYASVPYLGTSEQRVDVAVLDPTCPQRYLLGILTDGPQAAVTARDRERLRVQVLESLGWRIHRVWSVDWFTHHRREVQRLRQALEMARAAAAARPERIGSAPESAAVLSGAGGAAGAAGAAVGPTTATPPDPYPVRPLELQKPLPGTVAYELATLTPSEWVRALDFADPQARREQVRLLQQLVQVEGPIHVERAIRRLAKAWGVERISDRVRRAGEELLACPELAEHCRRDGDFLYRLTPTGGSSSNGSGSSSNGNGSGGGGGGDATTATGAVSPRVLVRVPVANEPATQRPAAHIPPEEWQAAMRLLTRLGVGIDPAVLVRETAKLFGLRPTDALRAQLAEQLAESLRAGQLQELHGKVRVPASAG